MVLEAESPRSGGPIGLVSMRTLWLMASHCQTGNEKRGGPRFTHFITTLLPEQTKGSHFIPSEGSALNDLGPFLGSTYYISHPLSHYHTEDQVSNT
jgi:hypothetical protein